MADPFQMGKNRHTSIFLYPLYQPLAAARNDYIYLAAGAQHGIYCQPIRGRDHLYRIFWQAGLFQPVPHQPGQQIAGFLRITAAAQDTGIA